MTPFLPKFDNTHISQPLESACSCSSVIKLACSFLWVLHTHQALDLRPKLHRKRAPDLLAQPMGKLCICTRLYKTVHASPGPAYTQPAPLTLGPQGSRAWEPRHRETPYSSHALFPSWPDGRTSGGYGGLGPGNGSEQLGRLTVAGLEVCAERFPRW